MLHRLTLNLLCCALLPVPLYATAAAVNAAVLVDEGQRATLTVDITVEGKVEKPQGHRDEVVKWSTQRAFKTLVEVVADKPESMSFSNTMVGNGGAQQAALAELQKQVEACGQDQACQMQVAMRMANSPAMQQPTSNAPQYQVWRAVEAGTRPEVSSNYAETLHTVFYTAARETTDCTFIAPWVSPELSGNKSASGQNWNKQSSEMLTDSARSFVVEVDGTANTGVLNIMSPLGVGFGDIKCIQDIGSGPQTSHHSATATLLPAGETKLPLQVSGAAAGNAVIARGSGNLELNVKLNNLGVGFAVDVNAPLKVVVRWELKKSDK